MSLINYDVSISPAQVVLGVAAAPDHLTVSLDQQDIGIDVKPSTGTIVGGAVAGTIVGFFAGFGVGALFGGGAGVGTVYAVAKLIQDGLGSAVSGALQGHFPYEQDFGQPLGYSIDLSELGITVGVTLATIQLSTFNGMLEAAGTVQVS